MGLDSNRVEAVNKTYEVWDYVISPNNYYNRCLNSCYRSKLNYLEIGYPRNDKFYNYSEEYVIKIKKELGIEEDKKIILYAPTFRDADINNDNKSINIVKIFKHFPNKYLILFRTHYFLNSDINNIRNIMDVSAYNDISDLMIISDVLIIDYSSVLFDYLNLKKPMIFFAYDLEHYRDIERGFYLEYDELPGPIVKDGKDLLKAIKDINNYWKKYGVKYNKFITEYCPYEDGQASKRAVDFIISIMKNRRK